MDWLTQHLIDEYNKAVWGDLNDPDFEPKEWTGLDAILEPMPIPDIPEWVREYAKWLEGDEMPDVRADDNALSVRTFESGATRDTDDNKYDYEGFLSPLVLERFAQYMHANRVQSDGSLRASDNWQKGIPLDAYMKSMFRHFMQVWTLHRAYVVAHVDGNAVDSVSAELEDALCALLFNVQGYLHEWITG